jgi:hypothetical protein
MLAGVMAASFCLAALLPSSARAQLSPGKLARAHHELEGITKCTSCHPYGKTLSNEKCLDCHKEIKAAVDSARGVHAHVADKRCSECHSDHNGEDFQIVRLDTAKFDHRTTAGFPLDGKHAGIACDSCHSWSHVGAPGVKALQGKRVQTLLGLSPSCVSCHRDIHRSQFSAPCSSCHDTKGWKPAPLFSHDRSRYPLTGKHREVACKECHNGTVDHSRTVLYRGMAFSTCESCHRDPHVKKFTRRLRRVPFHRGLEDNEGGNLRPPADGVPAQWKTRGCQMPGVPCPCSPYNECQRRTGFSHFKVSPLRGLPQGRPRRTVCRAPGRRKMRSVPCRQRLQEHPLYGREPSSEQLSLNRCARCDKLHRMPQARRRQGQKHKTVSLGKDSHVQHLPPGPAQGAIREREQEVRVMSRHRIVAFTPL